MNTTITTAAVNTTSAPIFAPITDSSTLNDLLNILGSIQPAQKTPTPKALREGDAPVARSADGSVTVYPSGYATYSDGDAVTVIFVPDCGSYTYYFDHHDSVEIKDSTVLGEDVLGNQPWEVALMLRGATQIENNRFNRTGNRKGTNGEEEEADDQKKRDERFHMFHYPDPLQEVIRKETVQEELAKLTEKQRRIYILANYFGYSQVEIAEQLGIAKMTVCDQLKAADSKVSPMLKALIVA